MFTSPMRFDLGEDIAAMRDMVHAWAQERVKPIAAQVDRDNVFPAELWREMGDLGLLGITVAEEYGGAGMGYLAHVIATAAPLPAPSRGRVSRRVKSFPITPRVSLRPDEKAQRWLLNISASDRAGLLYSVALVLARPGAFEYVLVHELCHLLQANHSPAFWREVEQRYPAWRQERDYFHTHGRHLKATLRALLSPPPRID